MSSTRSATPDGAPAKENRSAEAHTWLRFTLVTEVGSGGQRKLLAALGSPQEVLDAGVGSLEAIVGRQQAQALKRGPDPERVAAALSWLESNDSRLITLADADYPAALLQIADPPVVLYARGRTELLERPALAVVGSRNPTPGGVADAAAFAEALSNAGLTIVSGLALGIDAAAHRGGLAGASSSIAVLGTGLDRIYPARNRDLAHRLSSEGLMLSEFPLGTPAQAHNFPRRNRIISGLARGCLVVEAALRSGSLITARQALEQGREVFAIPGSIHSPLSKGCHWLIKQGAKLVESAQDVLEELKLPAGNSTAVTPSISTDLAAEAVLTAMGYHPIDLDLLCSRTGLTPAAASAMLLTLELDGSICRLAGGTYQRIR
jgi:DNA processing protein